MDGQLHERIILFGGVMKQSAKEAFQYLRNDHSRIKALFQAVHEADSSQLKGRLSAELIDIISVHFFINEEVLYPAIRKYVRDTPLIDYATGLQDEAKELMRQLEAMPSHEPEWDEVLLELEEAVREHIRDEELEVFARIQCSTAELNELAALLKEKRTAFRNRAEEWRETA